MKARRYYLDSYDSEEGASSSITLDFSAWPIRKLLALFLCAFLDKKIKLNGVKLSARVKQDFVKD